MQQIQLVRHAIEPLESRFLWSVAAAAGVAEAFPPNLPSASTVAARANPAAALDDVGVAQVSIIAVEAVAQFRFRGPVATLTDPPNAPAVVRWSWRVRVDWGDAHRHSGGKIVPVDGGLGESQVLAKHRYHAAGTYTVTINATARPRGRGAHGLAVQRLTASGPAAVMPADGLRPVAYVQSGGFAGITRTINISPTGHLTASGGFEPDVDRQLTAAEQASLLQVFANWAQLKSHYDPPYQASDAFTYVVSYGEKQVREANWIDVSATALGRAIELIETLADVP